MLEELLISSQQVIGISESQPNRFSILLHGLGFDFDDLKQSSGMRLIPLLRANVMTIDHHPEGKVKAWHRFNLRPSFIEPILSGHRSLLGLATKLDSFLALQNLGGIHAHFQTLVIPTFLAIVSLVVLDDARLLACTQADRYVVLAGGKVRFATPFEKDPATVARQGSIIEANLAGRIARSVADTATYAIFHSL